MACFGLVALVTLTSLKHRSAGWMTFLGALTYPLYLIHEKLGLYVIHVLNGRTGPWIAVGTAVVLALVAATLLYLVVERPWGGRLRAAMLHTLQRGTPGEQPAVPQQPDRSTLVRAHRPALIGHAPAARTGTRLPVPAGPHD